MALNFPTNPGAQTPVNTYSPTSTPSASNNGVTYIWDGEKWTASAESGESTFLRLDAANDPVTGAVTFNELTTHEAGVSVTGGDPSDIGTGIYSAGSSTLDFVSEDQPVARLHTNFLRRDLDLTPTVPGDTWYGFDARGAAATPSTSGVNVTFGPTTYPCETVTGVGIQGSFSGNISNRLAGFHSDIFDDHITGGGGHALNFLASGEAANHFHGPIRQYLYDEDNYNALNPRARNTNGVLIDHRDTTACMFVSRLDNNNTPCIRINRSGSATDRRFIDFQAGSSATVGVIYTDGTNLKISGLAGGPLRSDFDLSTSDGIIEALDNALNRAAELETLNASLKTRLEAIESNEVIDDATDSALLTLVANLATRVSNLEGANSGN